MQDRASDYENFYNDTAFENTLTPEGTQGELDSDDGFSRPEEDIYDLDDTMVSEKFELDPAPEAWILNEYYASKIQIEGFKRYLDDNWDLVEVDITERLAKQRRTY